MTQKQTSKLAAFSGGVFLLISLTTSAEHFQYRQLTNWELRSIQGGDWYPDLECMTTPIDPHLHSCACEVTGSNWACHASLDGMGGACIFLSYVGCDDAIACGQKYLCEGACNSPNRGTCEPINGDNCVKKASGCD